MKKTIAVAEIVADINNGMPNEELIKKYRLSENGLTVFFDKFIKAVATGSSHIEVESEE